MIYFEDFIGFFHFATETKQHNKKKSFSNYQIARSEW